MKSKDYASTRAEILDLVYLSLHAQVKEELKGSSKTKKFEVPAAFNAYNLERSEALLNRFESMAKRKLYGPFWYGVGQSVLGSILVFLLLGLLAIILYGATQNPFRMLIEGYQKEQVEKHQPQAM